MKINLKQFKSLFSVRLVAVAALCLILATSYIYSAMKKEITIEDIGEAKAVSTFKNTVGDVLEENSIQIRPEDRINLDMTAKLEDGLSIKISRAREITINADGKDVKLLTVAPAVRNALEEAKVQLGEKDRVEPGLDTELTGNTKIAVVRIEEKFEKQQVKMEFTNQVNKSDKLDKGIVSVVKKGSAGLKEETIKVTFENGKEAKRETVEEKVVKAPINGIIEEGTRTTFVSSRGQVTRFVRALKMKATAYDASYESCGKTPDNPHYGITYSGLKVRPGIVAVDPKVIPLGTYLYIEGYGEALAADIGGAIKGNRIDLYFESPKDVAKYGRRTVKVYVLDKPRYRF
ncbi:MAG TPA: ubiquitin-like domain-containing protein [Negativicutes bacterium]|nr:ubiquitin-like domain-containing protein [Negativicutes bacterium]